MTGWKECLLGDVITLKRGYDLPHSARLPGPFPVVSSSGITDHHAEPKVKAPGVVTGRYGTLGQVFFVSKDYWPLNTSLYVQDFKGNDPKFIALLLTTLSFGSQNAAGAVPGVNRNHLHAMEVSVPPLPTQRRIAGILSAYDDLIENSQRRVKILEEIARRLYREWFVYIRFPGHEGCRLVQSPLGEIPEGWEVKALGQIAEEVRRNVPKGGTSEPKLYVGLEHIPRRSLSLDAWETARELGSNKLRFNKGEVLFGKIRPYFHKVSVAPFDGICSADTIVIRALHQHDYAFVVGCVSSDEFVAEASASANGAKMPRANWEVLKRFPIALPPSGDLAEKFSALFVDILSKQQALVFKIQNLRRTRDLLLPRLLSGQIDVEALPEPVVSES